MSNKDKPIFFACYSSAKVYCDNKECYIKIYKPLRQINLIDLSINETNQELINLINKLIETKDGDDKEELELMLYLLGLLFGVVDKEKGLDIITKYSDISDIFKKIIC